MIILLREETTTKRKKHTMFNFNEKMSSLLEAYEVETMKARWSLEKFETNPARYAPQLENMKHHLRQATQLVGKAQRLLEKKESFDHFRQQEK